jgi:UDP-glucose 4-epimerase
MKHVLITGGAGYIGSHALLAAAEAGLKAVVVDNLYSGFRAAVPEGVPFYEGSILDSALLDKVFSAHKITSVMHFAAHLEVEESTREPLKYYENNVYGTLSLLKACQRAGSVERFVFSSTCATYGNPAQMPVDESCAQNPISPYGSSKLATEMLIKDFCQAPSNTMSYALLRYFNVAGADPQLRAGQSTPRATQLIKACAEAATGKRAKLIVFGTDYNTPDGTCIRDYIHVSDLATAHVLALDYLEKTKTSDCFNLGYGTGYSVLEIIASMKKVSDVDFAVEMAPRRAGDAEAIYADPAKAHGALGFEPRYADLDLICKTAFEWERKRRY